MEISLVLVTQMLSRFGPCGLVRLGGCSNRTYQQVNHRFTCTCARRYGYLNPANSEQIMTINTRNLFVFEVGPSVKFVSAIIDAIFNKKN